MESLMGRILSYIFRCLCGDEDRRDKEPETFAGNRVPCYEEQSPLLRTPLIDSHQIYDNGDHGRRNHGLLVVLEQQQAQASKPAPVLKPASSAPITKPCKVDPPLTEAAPAQTQEIWKKHYCSSHRILLVGEGDFSFSSCLAMAFGSASNITATSLNSKEFLRKNYTKAMENIDQLKTRGSVVIHGVDATKMAKHGSLKGKKFDRIIFNFPHGGFSSKESAEEQIQRHQKLLRQFFKNAKKMIKEDGGEVHVRHKTNGFHKNWDLESLGSDAGLKMLAKVKFKLKDYPGYNTKYGFGGDKNFDCQPSCTYKFGV
ncbi:Uncharacterized protein At4g26485 [Linum perenne]